MRLKMECERKRSKGSFFNFFDWNGKSRKKLFAKDPELPEGTELGKESKVEPLAKLDSHVVQADLDKRQVNSSTRESCDFSCTSSITSDDGFGSRAPGVVARLMGLNSLPTSNTVEPSLTPFFGSFSHRETQNDRTTPKLYSEYNPMEPTGFSRSQKVQNRPIERFQTETLPPKSAKSIPVTHHKLLSPIRSPGFVPRQNSAYIVEAAAKIMEASPKANTNGRVPSISSPSVPLRIRELKQRMEAANTASRPQRSNEPIGGKTRKMTPSKGKSDGLSNKGKSISQAVHMKSNAQRKDEASSRNIRTSKQEKPSHIGTQKMKGTSESTGTSKILRQNNLKQNCQTGKESSSSKNSAPTRRGQKDQPIMQRRTVQKVGSKPEKMSEKMHSNGTTLKKRAVNSDPRNGRSVSIKCNIEVDGPMRSDIDERKGGMDVISFTFTSPVKKATARPEPSTVGKSNSSVNDSFDGLNMISADALGALLEKKLQELTNKVESSKCNIIRDDVSACSLSGLPNLMLTFDKVNGITETEGSEFITQKDNVKQLDDFECLSTEDSSLTDNQKWQGSAEEEECSSSSIFSQAEKDHYRHPSPVSILESSFESGSCSNTNADEFPSNSELSDSATSICTFNTKRKNHSTRTNSTEESNWELQYVRVILDNAETMLKDLELGKTSKAIDPQLFHHLENQQIGTKQHEEDNSKQERKVLFDCVNECLESISRRTFVGSCNSWAKLQTIFERKEWFANDLWKEILSWKDMGDSMVDELVDKDMSTRCGKWLEFGLEMFEEGVEIEKEIVNLLVDELVYDVFMV